MDMTGEYRIAAPREAVWAALNDPEVLRACIPGCESLEKDGDGMTASVVAKIGPVKAKFSGKVRLENLVPPESYSIVGEGQGGVAGFAKGGADVRLAADGAATILTYTAKAQIGGKLAQLGSRLIDGTAKSMADQFFSAFSEKVGGPADDGAPDGGDAVIREAAMEQIVHAVDAAERKVEQTVAAAAVKAGPSGPLLWGLAALAAVVIIIVVTQL